MSVTPNTIRKWKAQDKWDNELKGSALKVCVSSRQSKCSRSRRPLGNHNATKFGFFSKYLPAESVEIMQAINTADPADLLWDQIMIQYTAIIRAQKIMLCKITKIQLKCKISIFIGSLKKKQKLRQQNPVQIRKAI
ncbi:phage terminase small subunit-related protein [Sporolactobacillus shoreicorticis]|nr:phage terminase small subunit-related protein [Sporolactobacillus shoreicorticis]MCO7128020.1 phage terminase small subunit-related protein [Sporolactobacillus shoreicorticis]